MIIIIIYVIYILTLLLLPQRLGHCALSLLGSTDTSRVDRHMKKAGWLSDRNVLITNMIILVRM